MALARSRRDRGVDYWPGFVDALSTLVLGIIFLLTVFVVVQFFLSQEVAGKDTALARLVEVPGEADGDGTEVAPELGEVRVPDRVVGAAERHGRVFGGRHHHVAAHPEPRRRGVAVLALPHLAIALEEGRRHLGP